jgi:hypothetical protein
LQQCHDDNALFQQSPVVTLRSGTAALRLALWDEDLQRMVRFRDITVTAFDESSRDNARNHTE